MSRLQTGALELSPQPIGLDEVVPAALREPRRARRRRRRSTSPETLPRVVADPGLLERALANVIANAIGLLARRTAVRVVAGAVDGGVDIRVVDRGPGVPATERDRMFVPFQRLGDRARRAASGSAWRSRRGFVEAMGGEIEVEDTPGGGLTVVVRARAARVTRILVVDDEPQILRALATNLRARGYEVDLAATGEAALDARRAQASRPRDPRPRPARASTASR